MADGGISAALIAAAIATAASVAITTIANAILGPEDLGDVIGPKLSSLQVQTSSYGEFIKQVYGKNRIAGNIIWSEDIQEVETRTEQTSGGKGGGRGVTQTTVTYAYYVTLAIGICEGPVDALYRVWADGVPVDLSLGTYRFYNGSETQLPDSYIESVEGVGNVPAYRGLAYVVVEDFPLAAFGNRIPNFNFEIINSVSTGTPVEQKVKDIVLIPGSGEFVYDIVEQTKTDGWYIAGISGESLPIASENFIVSGETVSLNSHNYEGIANVLVALEDMVRTLPNVENVALVVNWFATSIEAGDATVVPKVEFGSSSALVQPDTWTVGSLDRSTAQQVLQFGDGTPTYGGTPSDKSVVRLAKYINETLGLNVMLYPMPLVDVIDSANPKPWRGRITTELMSGADTRIQSFFQGTDGLNDFILHYVNLSTSDGDLMDYCDSIVIGSEMIGLTSVHWPPASGTFPAVDEFISLAGAVKTALAANGNSSVKVVYAADWSEYHHEADGWFNLDPLWASSNIDIIGIDTYMPLTPVLPQSQIDYDTITQYFEDGEGWAYFYTDSEAKTGQTAFSPADGTNPYAWKNIRGWWEATEHVNPDASNNWPGAKPKPIWFTEFGFPSVDGAANQPNVFYDPSSSESSFPIGSQGRIDYGAQRVAIEAFIDYWEAENAEESNLIPRKFLWTWDARPYPYWPNLQEVWSDSQLYKYGHWIQGKFGTSSLSGLVAALCERVGLTSAEYNVGQLSDLVYGFGIAQKGTIRASIEALQRAYQFDMVESAGILTFVPRGNISAQTIPEEDLVTREEGKGHFVINRAQKQELPTTVDVNYVDLTLDYQVGTQYAQRQTIEQKETVTLSVNLVTTEQHAKEIADITLFSSWLSSTGYKFILPPKYARIEPTDVITVTIDGVEHQIRVTETSIRRDGTQEVTGVADDVASYDFYTEPGIDSPNLTEKPVISKTGMFLLDLPALPSDTGVQGYLRLAPYAYQGNTWPGALFYRSDDGGEAGGNTFAAITSSDSAAITGITAAAVGSGPRNMTDYGTEIDVILNNGELSSVTELAMLNGANTAVVGNEIIQFQTATLVSGKRYTLSNLLRGRLGTEHYIDSHTIGEQFIFLDATVKRIDVGLTLFGLLRHYKGVTIGGVLDDALEQEFTYSGNCLKPYSVVHPEGEYSSNDIVLSWVRRTRLNGDWKDGIEVPLSETSESYEVDIMDGETVLRTLTSSTPTVTYTQAQQSADFGSGSLPLSSLKVRIYQISEEVGRGIVNEITLGL